MFTIVDDQGKKVKIASTVDDESGEHTVKTEATVFDTNIGSTSDAPWTGEGDGTVISILKAMALAAGVGQ